MKYYLTEIETTYGKVTIQGMSEEGVKFLADKMEAILKAHAEKNASTADIPRSANTCNVQ